MTKKRGGGGRPRSTARSSSTCSARVDDRVGPVVKNARNAGNKQKLAPPAYWARLAAQFKVCDYPHARAYSPMRDQERRFGVQSLRDQIEEEEQKAMARKDEPSARHKEHWDRLSQMGCIITSGPATIAHCHGGSISEMLGPLFRPGIAQRQNHWLTIPLVDWLHQGPQGLDTGPAGVTDWEQRWGLQVHLLEEVSSRLGYCVFEKAGIIGYSYQTMDRPE